MARSIYRRGNCVFFRQFSNSSAIKIRKLRDLGTLIGMPLRFDFYYWRVYRRLVLLEGLLLAYTRV